MSSVAFPTKLAHPHHPVAKPAATTVLEEHRWERWLLPSFVAGATFFGAAIATGEEWLMGFAVVLGPITLTFAYIYVMLSADTNSE